MSNDNHTSPAPPSLEDLARRYLDLWQDQWAAVCADTEMADTFARTVQGLGQTTLMLNPFLGGLPDAGSSWPTMPTAAMPQRNRTMSHDTIAPPSAADGASPTGAAPVGAAPHSGADRVADLSRRIALLEERIAAFAADSAPTGGGTDDTVGGKRSG